MLICEVIEILLYISWLRHELDQIMFCQVNNIPLERIMSQQIYLFNYFKYIVYEVYHEGFKTAYSYKPSVTTCDNMALIFQILGNNMHL